jgi:hypothetical protein
MESFRVTFFGSPLCCLSTPILISDLILLPVLTFSGSPLCCLSPPVLISDLILLPVLFFLKQAGELHIFVLREEKEGKESHTRQPS